MEQMSEGKQAQNEPPHYGKWVFGRDDRRFSGRKSRFYREAGTTVYAEYLVNPLSSLYAKMN